MVFLLCTQNYFMINSRINFPELLIALVMEKTKKISSCVQIARHYNIRKLEKYLSIIGHRSKLL